VHAHTPYTLNPRHPDTGEPNGSKKAGRLYPVCRPTRRGASCPPLFAPCSLLLLLVHTARLLTLQPTPISFVTNASRRRLYKTAWPEDHSAMGAKITLVEDGERV